ncbi:NHS-like protein 1 isoform X2 [Polyodon spathula]|uniref:NHS-like protein 1 isoform X2 n=1 Tax=Polyodon spathula TaxID=7913 RepID=UPI001B7DAD5E|nr:NHS-like protein 1 isoform X2 [Polyodon spathula]
MPFHQRTVEPQRVSRLNEEDYRVIIVGDRGEGDKVLVDRVKVKKKLMFTTLEEVCCNTLTNVLRQLSDLSRHASNIFLEIERETGFVREKSNRIQNRLEILQSTVYKTDKKKIRIPVSNLDDESKWTVHYTAPWHQQENVFLPTNRPACVEDLHRQAKVNLKTVLRECDKLRNDGFRSSQYYSQGPTFSSSNLSDGSLCEQDDPDRKSTVSSTEDEKLIFSVRPKTPILGDISDIDIQTNWTKSLPLPTPEEKMRQQAQAVQADVVPINVTAGHNELRGYSMYIPGQYSTLGRIGSGHSTLRRSETRDSSCQTEEIKIVQPSVRRIRAQKGQGIAAQMSLSNSSGNMSTVSDTVGVLCVPQVNGDLRFHSLPRSGARVSLQSMEKPDSAVYKSEETSCSTLPRQISKLQVDESVIHLRNTSMTGILPRPRSQKARSFQSDRVTSPACVVSPHATYSTSVIPNATLSSSTEVITIHTSQSSRKSNNQTNLASAYAPARPMSTISMSNGIDLKEEHDSSFTPATMSPRCDSAVSLSTGNNTETGSQCSTLDGRSDCSMKDARSDSSYSESSFPSRSTIPADQWIYDTPENVLPHKSLTSSCSTTINHIYSSLERSSNKTDTSSLYSMDNDGYYTSMHLDSGLKARSQYGTSGMGNSRHSMYESRAHQSQDDRLSMNSDKSLSRTISMKKSKKPPLPPFRTDSLKRKPGKKSNSNDPILNETLIDTFAQSLQPNPKCKSGSTPQQSPSSDYDDPWVLRSRSQSTVSASSSGMSTSGPNIYSICPVTPSQSDTSSIRSEYADAWGYYIDFTGVQNDQLRSESADAVPGDYGDGGNLPSGSRVFNPQQGPGTSVKTNMDTSPDKVHRVTSPSSGYSSQSNTPTAGTPVPVFLRSISPAGGKSKPKVPERKSSLLSSVSSSSTSLSSITSDTPRNHANPMNPPPSSPPLTQPMAPPVPPPLPPGPVMDPSLPCGPPKAPPLPPSSTMVTPLPVFTATQLFPPPPAPPLPPLLPQVSAITSPTAPTASPPPPSSPSFPPPPPEVLLDLSSTIDVPHSLPSPPIFPVHIPVTPPPPPPPAPPLPAVAPPPAPPLNLKALKYAIKPTHPLSICNNQHPASNDKGKRPTNQPESSKTMMPLITPKALKMVQLRSVRKPELIEVEKTTQNHQVKHELIDSQNHSSPEKPKLLEHPTSLQTSSKVNGLKKPPTVVKNFQVIIAKDDQISEAKLGLATSNSMSEMPTISNKADVFSGTTDELQPCTNTTSLQENEASPSKAGNTTPPEKILLVFSKKPNLTLIVPPGQTLSSKSENQDLTKVCVTKVLSPQSSVSITTGNSEVENGPLKVLPSGEETDSGSSTPVASDSLSSESTADGFWKIQTFLVQQEEQTLSDNKNILDVDGGSSASGSISSNEDESGEVFETNTANLSPVSSTCGESSEEMVTPTRPRTTDDLFAAIHRSKRRVLGRKDSEEDHARNHSTSPPVTPTCGVPILASPHRQTGSIQRSIRKSATSSDTFKALLLKKGSRSETSFRMSATEMLKNTAPKFQRTCSESTLDLPDSPSSSPGKNKSAQDEWVKTEGLLPRSAFLSGTKYSRSRTPPSAASSRYNARNRILSSPMTVICEGEGELAESIHSQSASSLGNVNGMPTSWNQSSQNSVYTLPLKEETSPQIDCSENSEKMYPPENCNGT